MATSTQTPSEETQIALMAERLKNIERGVVDIRAKLKEEYAQRHEVEDIKSEIMRINNKLNNGQKVLLTIIGLIGSILLVAFMNLILRTPQ